MIAVQQWQSIFAAQAAMSKFGLALAVNPSDVMYPVEALRSLLEAYSGSAL
jgi:hypothetical protein